MSTASANEGGFFTFFREYAHTSIHSVTATALTAFGLLTFVHRGFVILAIAVYVLPPIYFYLTRDGEADETVEDDSVATIGRNGATEPAEPTTTESARAGEPEDSDGAAEPDATGGTASVSGAIDSTEGRSNRSEEPRAQPAVSDPAPEDSAGVGSTAETETERSADEAERSDEPPESAPASAGEADTGATDEPESTDESPASDQTEPETEAGSSPAEPAEWTEIDAPTEEALFDAVAAAGNAYAVGSGGVLLVREDEWEIALDHGPAAESTTLRGVDATDDGRAVWVAGDGGVLARYDPEAGRHTDHSAPKDITDNWAALAVAGGAGGERIYLVNGSGQVLAGEYDGGAVEWDDPIKPGSGSSMSAIEFTDGVGYCCDTNSGVYEIEEGSFERIGIESGSAFTTLAATDEVVAVADDDGTIQRFDGTVWTPMRAADVAITGLDTDGEEWIAVGDGGTIREQRNGRWEPRSSPTETDLSGVALGDPSVAVGSDGTVLEYR